jgi:hypothetical protein
MIAQNVAELHGENSKLTKDDAADRERARS